MKDTHQNTLYRKWTPIEQNGPGQFDWSGTDKIATWLWQNKKTFRGHCGLWDQATPSWVEQLDGDHNKGKLGKALYNHIYAVVHRYGKVSLNTLITKTTSY